MSRELQAQMGYLREAGLFNVSARRGEPGNAEDFAELSDFERRQIVRETAVKGLERLKETTPGVPWVTDDMDWSEAAILHLEQGGARTLDDYQSLREAGVPLVDQGGPAPVDHTEPELLQAMAEAGVPLRGGSTPQLRELTPLAALADLGVPLREASTQTAWRADERAHHVIASGLAEAIPAGHPDHEHLAPILRAGAALASDQKALIDALASKHAAGLAALSGAPAEDADVQTGLQESASLVAMGFREGTTPGKYTITADEDDDGQRNDSREVLTGEAALVAAGVPLRDGGGR